MEESIKNEFAKCILLFFFFNATAIAIVQLTNHLFGVSWDLTKPILTSYLILKDAFPVHTYV